MTRLLGEPWMGEARCLDLRAHMFPVSVLEQQIVAREVCSRCPVREQCGEFAIEAGEVYGVWGGMTERDLRRAVARRRGVARVRAGSADG